jgi:addiction module HigA family antidote
MATRTQRAPLHPGEILRDQFMMDFDVSINRLARELRVPPTRISEIVNERRSVTPDTALRLARYFGTSAEFWMNLQIAHDLDVARSGLRKIEAEIQPIVAA